MYDNNVYRHVVLYLKGKNAWYVFKFKKGTIHNNNVDSMFPRSVSGNHFCIFLKGI